MCSNIGSGGGGGSVGVNIKDIENTALKQTMQDIVGRVFTRKSYPYNQSVKDGKAIDKNTNVGDQLVYTSDKNGDILRVQKTGDNAWTQEGIPTTADGVARMVYGLFATGGTWTYRQRS